MAYNVVLCWKNASDDSGVSENGWVLGRNTSAGLGLGFGAFGRTDIKKCHLYKK